MTAKTGAGWLAAMMAGFLAFAGEARGFAVPLDFSMKCGTADVIVRGVVVDLVPLVARGGASKRGEKEADDDFQGPLSVAIVRVTAVLKPETKNGRPEGMIYVPCGYTFDESPCELTDGREYVLFLKANGNNFFSALDFRSTHRVVNGVVGMSGLDGDLDFSETSEPGDRLPFGDFVKRVEDAKATSPGAWDETTAEPVPGKLLREWGYQSTKLETDVPQGAWEEKQFGKAKVTMQSIKAVEEVKDMKDAYYRFRITRETYGSEEEAKQRIARVRESPPGIDTKMEPHRVLCDGRTAGKSAYIISTDVQKFALDELPRLIGLLEKEIARGKE